MANSIFVFGSNEGGYHGRGAAFTARKYHGAVMGVGVGLTGDSYAIPTKDRTIRRTLSLAVIRRYIYTFIKFANEHPELTFKVTRIGCGLAGLNDHDIAPMFANAPVNCEFDEAWKPYLGDHSFKFWGTF